MPPRAVQRSLGNTRNTHMVTSLITEHTVSPELALSLQVHWLCSFWVTLKSHHLCQSLGTISLFSYQSSFLRLLKAQREGSEDGTTHNQCSATFPDSKTAPFPASLRFKQSTLPVPSLSGMPSIIALMDPGFWKNSKSPNKVRLEPFPFLPCHKSPETKNEIK